MMLWEKFQTFLEIVFVLIFVILIMYGNYCNRKSRSFAGTGRMADMEAWSIKAVLIWITTFILSISAFLNFV